MNKVKNPIKLTAATFGVSVAGVVLLLWTMDAFEEHDAYFQLLIGVLLMILGGAVLIAALFTRVFSEEAGEGCTVAVDAVISEVRQNSVTLGDTRQKAMVYMPNYTFSLNGETKTISSYKGSYQKNHYVVGTQVELMIDPEKPEHCYVPADTRKKVILLRIIWIVLIAAGAAVYVSGLLMG